MPKASNTSSGTRKPTFDRSEHASGVCLAKFVELGQRSEQIVNGVTSLQFTIKIDGSIAPFSGVRFKSPTLVTPAKARVRAAYRVGSGFPHSRECRHGGLLSPLA